MYALSHSTLSYTLFCVKEWLKCSYLFHQKKSDYFYYKPPSLHQHLQGRGDPEQLWEGQGSEAGMSGQGTDFSGQEFSTKWSAKYPDAKTQIAFPWK